MSKLSVMGTVVGQQPSPILHCISGLQIGGAETMLCKLLGGMDRQRFPSTVLSLRGGGPTANILGDLGVEVLSVDLHNPFRIWSAGLQRYLTQKRFSLVQGWMYHGNLMAGLLARNLLGNLPLSWNVRSSVTQRPLGTLGVVIRANKILSKRLPQSIIFNSRRSLDEHIAEGWCSERSLVIGNGFDMEKFRAESSAGAKLRELCGFAANNVILGHVARFDPAKDHQTLFAAMAKIIRYAPRARLVCIGNGVVLSNQGLALLIRRYGLESHCSLLGVRSDVASLTAGFDIGILSSRTEAFPNVVGEAMSCCVPCVVTNVGDAAMIVGNTGVVVPPGQPEQLANGILNLIAMDGGKRIAMGWAARDRIAKYWSLASVSRQYTSLYNSMIDRQSNTSRPTG